jgi:hypothetical protein
MTTDELLQRVAAQPMVTVERDVSIPGPAPKALLAEGKPIPLTELVRHPDQHSERRTFQYGHVLGPGLSPHAIASWQASHPAHPLPPDLIGFLRQVDGVHLWADLASGRAYFGILPMNERQDAGDTDWAMMFDAPHVAWARGGQDREPGLLHIPTECQGLVVPGRPPVEVQDDWSRPDSRKFDRAAGRLSDFAAAKHLSKEPPPPGDKCSETEQGENNDQPSEDHVHHRLRVVCQAERRAVERPRRRKRNARPQQKYTAAAVRSSGGLGELL